MFGLKTRRSAGVKVTDAVYRLIESGNLARDAKDPNSAACAYASALNLDPKLAHIWVQLGHMRAEIGQWEESAKAYDRALAGGADPSDVRLHIGHLQKRSGKGNNASTSYLDAARAGNADALDELTARVSRIMPVPQNVVARAIRKPVQSPIDTAIAMLDHYKKEGGSAHDVVRAGLQKMLWSLHLAGPGVEAGKASVTFDISDLVGFFRYQRLPTGIQRVQLEVISRAIFDDRISSRICCFVFGGDHLVEIPLPMFMEVADLAARGTDGGEESWVEALVRLFIMVSSANAFEFRAGETLVNLGTSWWIANYSLMLRNAKALHGLRYLCFVHDLIPVFAASHVVENVKHDYIDWLSGAYAIVDQFVANSHSTARDLVRAGRLMGHSIDEKQVIVAQLDGDFRRSDVGVETVDALHKWHLSPRGYVLLVSTIESRKNHILALEAWSRLVRDREPSQVPQLVLVGRKGWLYDHVWDRLESDSELNRHVTHVERASDEDLALLYRHCLVTLYPSHYEGWGLPITESLSYGRVPIVANNSSLPEAGGQFALIFETNSINSLVDAVSMIFDHPDWLVRREAEIEAKFRPRPWSAIASQIIDATLELTVRAQAAWQPPLVQLGRYYPIKLSRNTRIWPGLSNGEMFRFGEGWYWPQWDGAPLKPEGGVICLRTGQTSGHLRLYFMLRGLRESDCAFLISLDGRTIYEGSLEAGTARWTGGMSVAAPKEGVLEIRIEGNASERAQINDGGLWRLQDVSISVAGFYLCDDANDEDKVKLQSAQVLGCIDDIDAFAMRANRSETSAMHVVVDISDLDKSLTG